MILILDLLDWLCLGYGLSIAGRTPSVALYLIGVLLDVVLMCLIRAFGVFFMYWDRWVLFLTLLRYSYDWCFIQDHCDLLISSLLRADDDSRWSFILRSLSFDVSVFEEVVFILLRYFDGVLWAPLLLAVHLGCELVLTRDWGLLLRSLLCLHDVSGLSHLRIVGGYLFIHLYNPCCYCWYYHPVFWNLDCDILWFLIVTFLLLDCFKIGFSL